MGAAPKSAAEIAHEGAHVISAPDDEPQLTRDRQVMRDPPGLVQVDAHGAKLDVLAPMHARIRALAGQALVARRRRDLAHVQLALYAAAFPLPYLLLVPYRSVHWPKRQMSGAQQSRSLVQGPQ